MPFERGSWSDALAAFAAVAALLIGFFGWQYNDDDKKDDKKQVAAPPSATAPAAPAVATPAVTSAGPAPPAAGVTGDLLTGVERIAGTAGELPDTLDPASYPDALVVECPSNQTGDQSRELKYNVDGRYRTFTADVSGWAEAKRPDDVQLRISAGTRQIDDTVITEELTAWTGRTNTPGGPITARIKGATELSLVVGCHKPGGVVIISNPRLQG
ncbi:hypothetical protein [Actinoplanes friuliensis]|uniref:Uncharacterized protein n=1 Tax=Actinoplanes friuliensis DSM 7358 TaxID=1246995 RepID=U5W5D1_9ACTN|nr:hypothetical protein [Actinoplanes friuliensis]AGZ44423.1 hypothetical protein AFR_30815 [Actinoplanes friuliensis DSM 7358]